MIDAHVHLFPESVARKRDHYTDDPGFNALYKNDRARLADSSSLKEYMERFSLTKIFALGFSWQTQIRCEEHNDAIIRVKSDRIVPFASMPSLPVYDVDERCGAIRDAGFAGVGEVAFYGEGLSKASAHYLGAIFAACARHRLIVVLHINEPVGHDYPGKYSPGFDVLYKLIVENPEVKIVLSHFGGGMFLYESMPEVRAHFKNVFYDTAAAPFIFDEKIYAIARAAGVIDKVLFGTDYPLMTPERFFPFFSRASLTGEEVALITQKNSERLLDSYPS